MVDAKGATLCCQRERVASEPEAVVAFFEALARRFRHNVPRLSSISRCLGPIHIATPFHHLSGDSHINSSLTAGPLRHLVSGLPKEFSRAQAGAANRSQNDLT